MKTSANILVVDDDEKLLSAVKRFLASKGFGVMAARDGSSAAALAREALPQLVLSDWEMPGMDGRELCLTLKRDPRTAAIPVILMSGIWISDQDQIGGLDAGADDYLRKPFSLDLLLARVRAVLRRFAAPAKKTGDLLAGCGISLDCAARAVAVGGKPVRLTAKEFDLLVAFLRKPGRVLKPGLLLESVWGYDPADYDRTHTVEVHVCSLRRKLGPAVGKRLVNVIGCGYKFE